VILKTVPLLKAPPSGVVPYKFPSVAWNSGDHSGFAPSVPSKLCSTLKVCAGKVTVSSGTAGVAGPDCSAVKVCAGRAIAVVAHSRKRV
jgi:hypothetical protein